MPEEGHITKRTRKYQPVKAETKVSERFLFNKGTGTTSVSTAGSPRVYDFTGRQETVSEGHPWPPRNNAGLSDLGGEFYSKKQYCTTEEFPSIRIESSHDPGSWYVNTQVYKGPVLPYDNMPFPPSYESSNDDLNELGATAIARAKPTNSVANVATFLGETIKEGLPSLVGHTLWRSRAETAKNAGSEYLNVQFGWRPLLKDITDFGSAVVNASTVLQQYERDAGKVVRRKYYFPLKETQEETVLSTNAYPIGPYADTVTYVSGGRLVRRREIRQRQWFSGAFTYYLPSGYDSRNELDRLALLADRLGLKLTPEVLWNLAPWSWAADWFSNAGDVLSNVSSFVTDGLVLRYGYMMENTIVKDTYTLDNIGWRYKSARHRVPPVSFVTETKIRKRANPYGFGVSWDGLSTFQLSILAALGITRR